jgi:anti-sigma regulatory factor (Ser/Thr protein kinase)
MSTPVQLDVTVDAAPTAAREARSAVARRGLVSSGREPTLLLLVSELVSNSVRHAGLDAEEGIRLRARCDAECAYVEVCDGGRSGRVPAKRVNGDAPRARRPRPRARRRDGGPVGRRVQRRRDLRLVRARLRLTFGATVERVIGAVR